MPDTKDTFNSIATVYDKINDIISLGRHKDWKSFFISITVIRRKNGTFTITIIPY